MYIKFYEAHIKDESQEVAATKEKIKDLLKFNDYSNGLKDTANDDQVSRPSLKHSTSLTNSSILDFKQLKNRKSMLPSKGQQRNLRKRDKKRKHKN